MRPFAIALVLATISASCCTIATAQKSQQVHGEGCVEPGAESRCLVVKDPKARNLYILIIKGMQPEIGAGIEFAGVPHNGVTTCMQGTPIAVRTWARKDSLKCSQGAPPRKWR
jgi:hypothetical protein